MEWRAIYQDPNQARLAVLFSNRTQTEYGNRIHSQSIDSKTVRITDVNHQDIKNFRINYSDGLLDLSPYFTIGGQDFSILWPSGLFSDLTLVVSGKTFKVHRALLAPRSPYFLTLFTKMKESRQEIITINEVDPELFSELLDLIYGQPIKIIGLRTIELLNLAQYFQIFLYSENDVIEEAFYQLDLSEIREAYELTVSLLGEFPEWLEEILFDSTDFDPDVISPIIPEIVERRRLRDEEIQKHEALMKSIIF